MLRQVQQGIWEVAEDQRILGSNLGVRANIIKTNDGFVIHSPIELRDSLKNEIDSLGSVSGLIAPNLYHHMYVRRYLAAYPDTRLYVLPALLKKRSDLTGAISVEDGVSYPWSEDLDHFTFIGGRWFQELIFFHWRSKTLILTDFAFNIQDTGSRIGNFLLKIDGSLGRFGQTGMERLLIRDRKALRAAYERIMAWDFERISVTHGEQIENNAKEIFTAGLEPVL